MIRTCEAGHPPVRLLSGARCPACARRREATRPSCKARGYGREQAAARRALVAMCRGCGAVPCAYGCGTLVTAETVVAVHVFDVRPEHGWMASCARCNERVKHANRGGGRPQDGRMGATPVLWQLDLRPSFTPFSASGEEATMIDDSAALRARLAAVTAERDALLAQRDPARRVWTTGEISGMGHEAYLANEREVLAALREERVRRDDAPQAVSRPSRYRTSITRPGTGAPTRHVRTGGAGARRPRGPGGAARAPGRGAGDRAGPPGQRRRPRPGRGAPGP